MIGNCSNTNALFYRCTAKSISTNFALVRCWSVNGPVCRKRFCKGSLGLEAILTRSVSLCMKLIMIMICFPLGWEWILWPSNNSEHQTNFIQQDNVNSSQQRKKPKFQKTTIIFFKKSLPTPIALHNGPILRQNIYSPFEALNCHTIEMKSASLQHWTFCCFVLNVYFICRWLYSPLLWKKWKTYDIDKNTTLNLKNVCPQTVSWLVVFEVYKKQDFRSISLFNKWTMKWDKLLQDTSFYLVTAQNPCE